MKMKYYFKTITIALIIISSTSSLSSYAQLYVTNAQLAEVNQLKYGDFMDLQKESVSRNIKEDRIKGSAYLNSQFLLGHIIMYDTIQYSNVPLRYNIFNEQIEFKTSDSSYLAIYYPEYINEVVIDGRKFIYAEKDKKRFKTKGFYEVLFEGDFQLLVKNNIEFKYEQRALGYNSAKPPRFIRRVNTYFLRNADEKPKRITSRKQFKTTFNKIFTYFEENKSGVNRKEDLIEIAKLMEGQLRHRQKKILEHQVNKFTENL